MNENGPNWEKIARSLIRALEESHITQYAELIGNQRRLMWTSFFSGIFRGLGMAIGFSVLGAIALLLIGRIFGIEF